MAHPLLSVNTKDREETVMESSFFNPLHPTYLEQQGQPLLDWGNSSDSAAQFQETTEELRLLLGPLVKPLLRDHQGALNLRALKANDFDEFKSFLQRQAELGDQITLHFSRGSLDPYEKLLGDPKYESLLRLLYQQIDAHQFVSLSPTEAKNLVQEFQAELVEIDADQFAQQHFDSSEGRERLHRLLSPGGLLGKDTHCDLLKAVQRTARAQGLQSEWEHRNFTDQISLWNYFNLGVSESEFKIATEGTLALLKQSGFVESHLNQQQGNLLELASTAAVIGSEKIPPEQLQHYTQLAQEKAQLPDALSQAQVQLARLWLLAADRRPWEDREFLAEPEKLRAHLLNQTASLIKASEQVKTPEDFESWLEEIEALVKDPVPLGNSPTLDWIQHQVFDTHLASHLEPLPTSLRSPLSELTQWQQSWEASLDLGHSILLATPRLQSQDPNLQQDIFAIMTGLERARQGLSHGYKQHKSLSRGLSQLGQVVNTGDLKDLQAADILLNSLIHQLSQAESRDEVAQVIEALFQSLQEDGTLDRALQAAEMNGTEQFLGLTQTVAVIVGLAYATRGASLVVHGTGALARVGGAVNGAAQVTRAQRAVQAFRLGAQLSVTENALAVSTGEIRHGPETVQRWFKDALATGGAMALMGAVAPQTLALNHPDHLVKQMWAHYTKNGLKGMGHLAQDTGLEIVEELTDQYVRQALDGNYEALSEAELREITSLCLAGGGLKARAVLAQFKGTKQASSQLNTDNKIPTDDGAVFEEGKAAGRMEIEVSPANDNQGRIMARSQKPNDLSWAAAAGLSLALFFDSTLANASTAAGSYMNSDQINGGAATTLALASAGLLGMALKSSSKPNFIARLWQRLKNPRPAAEKESLDHPQAKNPYRTNLKTKDATANLEPLQSDQPNRIYPWMGLEINYRIMDPEVKQKLLRELEDTENNLKGELKDLAHVLNFSHFFLQDHPLASSIQESEVWIKFNLVSAHWKRSRIHAWTMLNDGIRGIKAMNQHISWMENDEKYSIKLKAKQQRHEEVMRQVRQMINHPAFKEGEEALKKVSKLGKELDREKKHWSTPTNYPVKPEILARNINSLENQIKTELAHATELFREAFNSHSKNSTTTSTPTENTWLAQAKRMGFSEEQLQGIQTVIETNPQTHPDVLDSSLSLAGLFFKLKFSAEKIADFMQVFIAGNPPNPGDLFVRILMFYTTYNSVLFRKDEKLELYTHLFEVCPSQHWGRILTDIQKTPPFDYRTFGLSFQDVVSLWQACIQKGLKNRNSDHISFAFYRLPEVLKRARKNGHADDPEMLKQLFLVMLHTFTQIDE